MSHSEVIGKGSVKNPLVTVTWEDLAKALIWVKANPDDHSRIEDLSDYIFLDVENLNVEQVAEKLREIYYYPWSAEIQPINWKFYRHPEGGALDIEFAEEGVLMGQSVEQVASTLIWGASMINVVTSELDISQDNDVEVEMATSYAEQLGALLEADSIFGDTEFVEPEESIEEDPE